MTETKVYPNTLLQVDDLNHATYRVLFSEKQWGEEPMKCVLTPVATALLVAAGASQAQELNYLSGDEIRALLAQPVTITLVGPGHTGNVVLSPDGTGVGEATLKDGKKLDVSGTWEIDGDQFCRKWEFNKPKRVCENWERVGERAVSVYIDDEFVGTNSW